MKRRLGFSIIIALLSATGALAQSPTVPPQPVTIRAFLDPVEIDGSQHPQVTIEFDLIAGHHAYKDMMKLVVQAPEGLALGELQISPTIKFFDKFSKRDREGLENQGSIKAPLIFTQSAQPGKYVAEFKFTYQICSDTYCLLPKTVPLSVPYSITKPMKTSLSPSAMVSLFDIQGALAAGGFILWIVVFIGGLLTSFTPCVFPMIPITISIIGARAAHTKRLKAFALSLVYVLGIALTYSLLGLSAALSGALFGSLLANPWVVGAISTLFVFMGLSQMGLFELQVPAFIRNRLGTADTGKGYQGAFLSGLISGIVASPCVGPVLVGVLTFVAQTKNAGLGFGLLFVFALGLGLPFLILGTFSGLVTRLPKAGPWMENFKVLTGYMLFGAALYFAKPFLSILIWNLGVGLLLILSASHLGAFGPAPTTMSGRLWKGSMFSIVTMASVWLAISLWQPASLISRPEQTGLSFSTYNNEIYDKAIVAKQPMIIDFTAEWCAACHELEQYTFSSPAVVEASRDFLKLRVDATTQTAQVLAIQKKFNIKGLPTVLFINSKGLVQDDLTVTGFVNSDDFLQRIAKTKSR
ncbi:MAG: sulfite exporter TauE/SafE family protein [Oligoflexia bacterium]|nr:sulfite exporter TauE/SafE family protein [Oligoflexia bacterium]